MTLLYLIRHARSTWNAEGRMQGQADLPLDGVGRQQAQALAARLQNETLHAIYSSPLARARETAEVVAALHGLPITFDDRLMERNLGRWTGLTGDEANEQFPERANSDWRVTGPPGGESHEALATRAVQAFDGIVAAHPDQAVAVISHGGTLSAYLVHLLGVQTNKHVAFRFDNTAIARVKVSDRSIYLLSVGDDQHLDDMRIRLDSLPSAEK